LWPPLKLLTQDTKFFFTLDCGTNGLAVHTASYGVDTTFPYDTLNQALDPGGSATTHDAPAKTCFSYNYDVSYSGNFQMYLMFRPYEGIPVPLKQISWNWAASAGSASNLQWSLIYSNSVITVNNQEVLNFPQWTQNGTNYVVMTNNSCN
jgi:hypothetical protein